MRNGLEDVDARNKGGHDESEIVAVAMMRFFLTTPIHDADALSAGPVSRP